MLLNLLQQNLIWRLFVNHIINSPCWICRDSPSLPHVGSHSLSDKHSAQHSRCCEDEQTATEKQKRGLRQKDSVCWWTSWELDVCSPPSVTQLRARAEWILFRFRSRWARAAALWTIVTPSGLFQKILLLWWFGKSTIRAEDGNVFVFFCVRRLCNLCQL